MPDDRPSALLMITTEFLPVTGGIGKYSFQLARNLASLSSQKMLVLTTGTKGAKEFDRHQQFTIYRAGGDRLRYLKIVPLFLKLLTIRRDFNIQHILATSWIYAGILGWLSNRLWGLHYSLFAYGLEVTKYKGIPFIERLMRAVLNRSSLIFAISHYTKARLEEFGVDGKKVKVVYGGVDPEFFRPGLASSQLKEKYSLENKKVIVTVGRLVKRKGHDLVIEALSLLLKEVPDLVYLIVGDGPERPRLKSLVERLKLNSNVRFATKVEDEALPYYYNLCQLMIMVNKKIGRDVEGFGLVFLEASACGKPVIGGRNGGVVDAVIDGQTGLLVDDLAKEAIARAILTLLKDEAYARKLGENGRQRVLKELNWQELSRKVFHYIGEVSQA